MTRTARRAAALALAAALAVLAGCATLRETFGPKPEGKPSGREGWLVYTVGALRFEAPAGWAPTGSEKHLKLAAPEWSARLEVSTGNAPFADEKACLVDAEDALARAGTLEHTRRHPTTFGGARGFALEGDSKGWHVWAWAACDGGTQYQVFLTAPTPAPQPVVEAQRTLVSSARIGGEV
jgi:hypothetical protein